MAIFPFFSWFSRILNDDNALYNSLRTQHAVLAFIHTVNTVAIIALTSTSNLFDVPLVENLPYVNGTSVSRTVLYEHTLTTKFSLAAVCTAFSALAAIDHLLCATVLNKWYMQLVDDRNNYFRWIEYAFSSSLMVVVVAMLSSIFSLSTLFCLFGLMMTVISYGFVIDQVQDEPLNVKRMSGLSLIPYAFMWATILGHFLYGMTHSEGKAPWFVWVIMISISVLFASFAVIHSKQIGRRGRWASYAYSETMFNLASLLSKSLLVWILVPGILDMGRG